jgi:outer membrane protein assembly factor BamE (lipoprotein component of BamABCDE complex)
MAKRRKLVFAVVLAVLGCWALLKFVVAPLTGLAPYGPYKSIKPGMTREEVVRRMGRPLSEESEFHLSQYIGFEKEYERAKQSNSKYYLFWEAGIDVTYAIGFDDEDRVTIKACGGT